MAWQSSGRVVVVGLGNPGSKYAATRHNIGFMLADAFASVAGISVEREKFNARFGSGDWGRRPLVILKPQTFMNLSGQALSQALSFFDHEPDQCVVLHDDLDLVFGDVRVKEGGGHGGHNGLRSLIQETGNRDFVRLRLGIGRPAFGDTTAHVLGRFGPMEMETLGEVLDVGVKALGLILDEGPKPAMNVINGLSKSTQKEGTGSD